MNPPDGPRNFKRRALSLLLPSAVMMSASQALIPAVAAFLARADGAEAAISGFAVAFGIALLAGLPQLRVQHLTLVFLNESAALPAVRKFVLQWAGVSSVAMLLVALTPLKGLVLGGVFSLEPDVERQAASALRAMAPLPGLLVMRSHLHGVALRAERPLIVWAGALTGAAVVATVAAVAITGGLAPGAAGGGIAFSAGAVVEVTLLLALTRGARIMPGPGDGKDVSYPAMVSFFWPLLVSALLPAVTQPVTNAGMARAAEATVSIAAVSVATGLFQTVNAGTNGVQAATMALLALGFPHRRVLRFMVVVGVATTAATTLIGFVPPVTHIVLHDILGTDGRLYDLAAFSFRTLSLLPLAMVIEQFYSSRLMRARNTRPIVYINMVRLAVLLGWVSLTLSFTEFTGAAVGAGAIAATLFAEAVVTYLYGRRRGGEARAARAGGR